MAAEEKFSAPDSAADLEATYPWNDELLSERWNNELELLASALRSDTEGVIRACTLQSLEMRASRREAAGLSPDHFACEHQREWLEGLERYVELEAWRQASNPDYAPSTAAGILPDLNQYAGFEKR